MNRKIILPVLVAFVASFASFGARAEEPQTPASQPAAQAAKQEMPKMDVKEMIARHEKMADFHKKAAECLKTKPMSECHDMMMKDCPCMGMDKGKCPHCKDKGTGKDGMHHHMHQDKAEPAKTE